MYWKLLKQVFIQIFGGVQMRQFTSHAEWIGTAIL